MRDIQLDNNGDLDVRNGDFIIGESDEQHVESILNAAQGTWKQHPLLGANLPKRTKMPITVSSRAKLNKNIKLQLEYDAFTVNSIVFVKDDIIIDCDRG